MTNYKVKYDFFDKDFNLLENKKYYSTCFASLYLMPEKSYYVRYFLELNATEKQLQALILSLAAKIRIGNRFLEKKEMERFGM